MIDCAVTKRSDGKTLKNQYLTDGAYKAIYGIDKTYKTDFEKLFNTYGTHVICSGVMGGRRDYSMRIQKNEIKSGYNVEGYLKAGYKILFSSASVEVDVKYSKQMEESSSFYSSSLKTVGGDSSKALAEEKDWINALNEDNAALMDFQRTSLVPIWYLCIDEERAKAIEQAATEYGKKFGN